MRECMKPGCRIKTKGPVGLFCALHSPRKMRSRKSKETNKLDDLKWFLKEQSIKYEEEYEFYPVRKWRFDLAFFYGDKKISVEYEGVFSEKSRHTTVTGYTKDCEKYNAATKLGWKVLRYTSMNVGQVITDIKQILKIK